MYPHPTLARGLPTPPCDPEVGLDGHDDLIQELSAYLDLPRDLVMQGFSESEALALVEHHRRRRSCVDAIHGLALALGVSDVVIKRACVVDGALDILTAVAQAKRTSSPTFLAWLPESRAHAPHE